MFNTKLRQIRRIRDLTQAQMAEKINITKAGYASWEQGVAEPSIESIKKICSILNVSSDELLEIQDLNINKLCENTYQEDLTPAQYELFDSIKDLSDRESARVLGYVEAIKRESNMRKLNQG